MNPVAIRIQHLLDERGEKLKAVADAIGVTYYSVYPWWTREHSKPRMEKVQAFADYFGVPVEHLYEGAPRPPVTSGRSNIIKQLDQLDEADLDDLSTFLDYLKAKKDKS